MRNIAVLPRPNASVFASHPIRPQAQGKSAMYFGLDMWSPNVNIFRDPCWDRGHETIIYCSTYFTPYNKG
jgi:hypothetical protein